MSETLEIRGTFDDRISPALKHMESGIIRVVGAFSALSTAIATLAAPVTIAADLQKQLLEVQKTTDYTSASIGVLSKELVGMSKALNVSASELAKIAAMGGQLGIGDLGLPALKAFTEEVARAVTALDVGAEEAATSIGKVQHIFSLPASSFREIVAVVNQISNVSTARPQELFDILRRIGNLGGSVTMDQATALAGVMIDVGLTAETAGTSLTKVFADMKADVADFSNFVGLSTAEWSRLVETNGVGALKLYLETLNKMPPAVAAATKSQLTGEGRIFGLITKLQEEMRKGGGLLDARLATAAAESVTATSAIKEQQSILSGLDAQWKVFGNNLKAIAIAVGNTAIPVLTSTLRDLSAELGKPDTAQKFVEAAKLVVSSIQRIGAALKSVVDAASSLGIDWGAVLRIGVILGAVQAAKGLGNAFSYVFGIMRGGAEAGGAVAASATALTSAYTKVSTSLMGVAEAHRVAALEAQRSAALQAQSAAAAATLAARQATVAAGRQLQAAATAAYGNDLAVLGAKQIAGTITKIERDEFNARLLAYRNMISGMGAALQAHALTEAQTAAAITSTQSSAVKQRLREQLAAIAAERAARKAAADIGAQPTAPAYTPPGQLPPLWQNPAAATTLAGKLKEMAGITDALAASTSTWQRVLVVTSGAVTLLGRAISFVATRLLGWLSMAYIVYEMGAAILSSMGLLDSFKNKIWSVLKLLGVKQKPEFLQAKEISKESEEIQKALDDAIKAKQKFDNAFGAISPKTELAPGATKKFDDSLDSTLDRISKVRKAAAEKLTFDTASPSDSIDAAKNLVDLLGTLEGRYSTLKKEAEGYRDEQTRLQSDVNSTKVAFDALNSKLEKDVAARRTINPKEVDEVLRLKQAYESSKEALEKFQKTGAVANSNIALGGLRSEIDATTKDLLSFFDKDTLTQFFDEGKDGAKGLVLEVSEATDAMEALQKKATDRQLGELNQPINTTGRNEEQLAAFREMQLEYNKLGDKAKAARAEMEKSPSMQKLALFPKDRASFLDSLIANAKGLSAAFNKATEEGEKLASLAKGKGIAVLPQATTPASLGAALAVALEYRKSMDEVGKFADAKAKDAAGAMARAIDRNKQDLREYQEFVTRLTRNRDQQVDRAITQTKTRAIDDGTATRQTGLNAAKALENDILNMIKEEGFIDRNNIAARLAGLEQARRFGEQELAKMLFLGKISKETYDREMGALRDSVRMQEDILSYYDQRGAMTSAEASALQGILDLKYRAADRKIVDTAEAQKSEVALQNISLNFNRLKREATEAAEAYAKASQRVSLANGSEDAVAAIRERDEAQAKLASSMGLLRAEAEKFSQVEPVAGKIMVPPEEVARMQQVIKQLSDTQQSLNTQSAGNEAGIYTRQANEAKSAQAAAEALTQSLGLQAAQLKLTNEQLNQYVAAARQLPEVKAAIAGINENVANLGAGTFPALNPEKIKNQITSIVESTKDIAIDLKVNAPTPEQVQAAGKSLAGAIDTALLEAVSKTETKPLKLNAEINVTKVNGLGTAELIRSNADGGPIIGAGTSRSDSILSWLSHGEWVMDARTVRAFGGGFFATLQSLARSGTNLSGVRASMQGFANGGPVMLPRMGAIGGDGLLQSIASEGGETVSVDISLNGVKRTRMKGARTQVNEFIDTLREVQKGVAR